MSTLDGIFRRLARVTVVVLAVAFLAVGARAQETITTTVKNGSASFEVQVRNAEVVYVDGNDLVLKAKNRPMEHLVVPDSDRFKIDGRDVSVQELTSGTKLTQTITTTTTPRYVTTVRTLKGKVWHVNPHRSYVILTMENGKNHSYQISNHAKLLINGKPKTAHDLRRGMKIEIAIVTDDTHMVIERSKSTLGEAPPPRITPPVDMSVIFQYTQIHVPAPVLLASAETPASALPKTGTLLPLAASLGLMAVAVSLGLGTVRRAFPKV